MKTTFKTFALMLLTALAISSCVDVPAPYNLPDKSSNSGGGGETTEDKGTPVTCAEAVELTKALADNATSTTIYTVTGYITQVVGDPSRNQQTFWMADTKDGGKVFEAYYANLPDGVTAFTVGTKVKITGKLIKFIDKTGNVICEMKNPTVKILEDDGGGSGSTVKPQGDGTAASPYNVAAIVAKVKAMAADMESTEEYYIKGKVNSVSTTASAISQYGNHTFTMVDEGDNSTVFTAFQVYGPGKQKFTSVDDIKVNDEVVVCGKVMNDTGNTPETVGKGAAYVVSINNSGNGGGGQGGGQSGNIEHITIAEFLAKADVNTTYELTGIVKNIANTTFGNFDLVEGEASIYIYGLLDLEGKNKNFSSLGIAEGDEVTLTGKYKLYNNKPEIENAQFVRVKKGDGGGGQGGDGGDQGGGSGDTVSDLVNGDFESWVSDTEPTGWWSASSASNATLSKSTEARNGSFACLVGAPGTQNKRLATQEMTLEAGSYTFSFYAKSTTGDICQSRGGYVPVTDGAVGSYKYGNYTDINNTGWTLVSYDFELTAKTTLCLLVMNPKGSSYSVSQDILVDDATLVKK